MSMPISRELFVTIMNKIKEQQEIDDKVGDALETVCGGWILFNSENKNLEALLLLLKELFVDVHDYIGWWLYESVEKIVTTEAIGPFDIPGKREWDLTTAEALYDFMEDCREDWIKIKTEEENKN
jgi:hypothetical protein